MRRVVVEPGVGARLEEAAIPVPGAGEVLVRSTLVGICGSDTHALAGRHPFLTGPYVPGHEATGAVVSTGPGVDGAVHAGQRVLLKPNVACGTCLNCRAGRTNACETLAWVGCDPSGALPGAMAGWFVAPAGNLYPVPDVLDDEAAALVECLATPVHAARIAGDLRGARVVVLGAGTIGLLCVVAALHAGASAVVVTDMEQSKLDRAVRVGAAGGVLATAGWLAHDVRDLLGGPADVVFDCVANDRSLDQAVGLLRRAGTLLVVGVPPRPGAVNLPLIQDWELRVQGCAAYTEEDIVTSLAIAVAGGLPVDEIVSATYGLDDVAEAFTAAGADTSGKVMISTA
ncbi:2-desacetyl-2-hydroxyethyl bacteriochlorophyllide A dehydrogenase [Promicromonospora sp. AC04]|uniref:zinc-dependent alcohol dehydrogenase n=1 Tax=Promicromonospora sp. AC04 TaxID=2135723 RepID=UPI000D34FE52|nr:alcohol dehydrogenase catalytic domain-containing protein [Promicromonospora sp. AC04]PUB24261.1 2-desacetyl-2-hydroxyethyl bacteriochlorophyllide A dehydrogenase [Promicromonospora sp. AC04]